MSNDNREALKQGQAQLDSIKEMVAAFECDYDRLKELKEEKQELVDANEEATTDYDTEEDPKVQKQLKANLLKTEEALMDWVAENEEELKELTGEAGDCEDQDAARQRIEEDALSVEVRSGWCSPGEEMSPDEYKILLCTGGPAVEIIGELDQYKQPCTARLMCQDWFTSWEELVTTGDDQDALLTYAQVFYFGD